MTAVARTTSMNNPGWATYTPTFSAAGGGAAIGDGTVTGMWRRVGDSVEVVSRITFGTTSTFGSGAFRVTLPNSYTRDAAKVLSGSDIVPGSAFVLDATNHANDVQCFVQCASGANVLTFVATRSTGAVVSATVPITFAQDDVINVCALVPVTGF